VSRWAPNARERLENAALDLFAENGYEEDDRRADRRPRGNEPRHVLPALRDKREVLFGGEDVLAGLFAGAIRAAPPGRRSPDACRRRSRGRVAMTPQLRVAAARRRLVVAANSELQERDYSSTPGSPRRSPLPCASEAQTNSRAAGGGDGHARFQRRVRPLDEGER